MGARVLLVTNDFPPTVGGIQSYLRDFVAELVQRCGAQSVVVFASTQDPSQAAAWDIAQPYKVVRWPKRVMLPTPAVRARMMELIRAESIDVVWFGAAAPLGLLAGAARTAGARRVVATTHGHEVGWAKVPGAARALREIGKQVDVVTYISEYTRVRLEPAFGPGPAYVALPSGVDTARYVPLGLEDRKKVREYFGLGVDSPLVLCASRLVKRKGQDCLIRGFGAVRAEFPDAELVIVGEGAQRRRLEKMAAAQPGVRFLGRVGDAELAELVAAADVFAMPARTRLCGLDVEGLGIVYLEAQACAVPVVAGDSGGAPETVTERTGIVVDGRDGEQLRTALCRLLGDADLRRRMGRCGRMHVAERFSWTVLGDRLVELLFPLGSGR